MCYNRQHPADIEIVFRLVLRACQRGIFKTARFSVGMAEHYQ